MDQFEQRLGQMQKAYEDSKAQQEALFGGVAVDPGVYEARLTKAVGKISKKGHAMIQRTHVITSTGDFEGIPVTDFMQVETDNGLAFIRRWIELCGKTAPAKAAGLKKVLEELTSEKPTVRIEVTRDGDYTNVSVIELVGAESASEAPAEEAPAEEQEVAPAEEAPAEEVDQNLAALKAFSTSQDIEVSDDDDIEAVKEKISAFDYEAAKLTSEEIDLLNSNELGNLIKRPEPAKAPAKTARPAAAPAKPAAKAPAKPAAKAPAKRK